MESSKEIVKVKNYVIFVIILFVYVCINIGINGCNQSEQGLQPSQSNQTIEPKPQKLSLEKILSYPSLLKTYDTNDSGSKFSIYTSNKALCNIEMISFAGLELFNIYDPYRSFQTTNNDRIDVEFRYGYSSDSSKCFIVVKSSYKDFSGSIWSHIDIHLLSNNSVTDIEPDDTYFRSITQSRFRVSPIISIQEIDDAFFIVADYQGLFSKELTTFKYNDEKGKLEEY